MRIEEILTGGKKPSAKKPAAKTQKPKAEPAAEAAQPAEAPAFARPDGEPDDLKKLPGVGPATERKLNALGVTQYAQIAAFTAEEIEQVDAALNLKGKIEQDDWPALAKELAGEG